MQQVLSPLLKFMIQEDELRIAAVEYIPENIYLGTAFIHTPKRTYNLSLGEFLKHHDRPNCMLITTNDLWELWTIEAVFVNHPLTLNYMLYDF